MCATKLFLCLSALLPLLSFNQAILLKSLVMFAENVTCHHISSHPLLHILKDQEGLTCQQKKICWICISKKELGKHSAVSLLHFESAECKKLNEMQRAECNNGRSC